MKISDKEVIARWKAAYKLAHDCINSTNSGLPDEHSILEVANTILGADLASGSGSINKYAGQDAGQESALKTAYDSGSARQVRPTRS